MKRSKEHVSICLAPYLVDYVREICQNELSIGHELPEDDHSFDDIHANAEAVIKALDTPMPVYLSEVAE